ncbi:class F sortase [Actinoplanes xinjiangensis]|uniref:Sortase family protein n=1 Tax=Actinoplanes xinjiangensis TaxID=512350 RepID=A0A316F8H3_9ACTN|nr:class F sortase [Actinoplanes xinjiangensis]PWK43503.1 sortase family protein [Actinoplanes xinjiangensis]GIF41820.1 hypothetical protein Axi01nite_61310 [Actinoplanes xinjiangensis]
MSDAGTTTSAGSRRGRYLLPAVILVLTTVGVAAIARGATSRTAPPPVATAVAATSPAGSGSAPSAPGASGTGLTTGPLMSTSSPTRISIPALRVTAAVIGLGQRADGTMQVPGDARSVGWYTRAPAPGALGPAILAGHVDYQDQPGTFARLADLKPGDTVNVGRADGSMAMFAVTKVERHPKNRFPTAAVYGAIDHAGLRLITCGGDFDPAAGHYEDNIVVYATLSMAHPA